MENPEQAPTTVYLLMFTELNQIIGVYSSFKDACKIKLKLVHEMMIAARDKMIAEYAANTDSEKAELIARDIKQMEINIYNATKLNSDIYIIGDRVICPYRVMTVPLNPKVETVRDSFNLATRLWPER